MWLMLPKNKLRVKVNQAVVEAVKTSAMVSLAGHRSGKGAADVWDSSPFVGFSLALRFSCS